MSDPFEMVNVAGDTAGEALAEGGKLTKSGNQYATAISVQKERDLKTVRNRFLAECRLAGESFYYSWSVKGSNGRTEVIEGPSIGLAMALARSYGNCVVETANVEETDNSYVITTAFVDLETGSTITRPFRQSKKSTVSGRMDSERKDDIRFQIAASKSARNCIIAALPRWLVDQGLREAKEGVRQKISAYIDQHGIAAAIGVIMKQLAGVGVTEEAVLERLGLTDVTKMDMDAIVMLRGDLATIQQGMDYAENIFPALTRERTKGRVREEHETVQADMSGFTKPKKDPSQLGQQQSTESSKPQPDQGDLERARQIIESGGTNDPGSHETLPQQESDTEGGDTPQDATDEHQGGESGGLEQFDGVLPGGWLSGLKQTDKIRDVDGMVGEFCETLEGLDDEASANLFDAANEAGEIRKAQIREARGK